MELSTGALTKEKKNMKKEEKKKDNSTNLIRPCLSPLALLLPPASAVEAIKTEASACVLVSEHSHG